jgi:Rrf2 family nitric oxide-sensitive transcriptional repressor
MRLTVYTDYTLRTLIYLALNAGRHATIAQIADTYRISQAHLTKVVHQLGVGGEIETLRGRNGGLRLKRPAAQINIGAVVRRTEPDLDLVPCFGDAGACAIGGACVLQLALHEALAAFLGVLDRTTLADLVAPRRRLAAMLGIAPPPRSRRAAVGLAS